MTRSFSMNVHAGINILWIQADIKTKSNSRPYQDGYCFLWAISTNVDSNAHYYCSDTIIIIHYICMEPI